MSAVQNQRFAICLPCLTVLGPVFAAAVVDQNQRNIQAPNETQSSLSLAASRPSGAHSSAATSTVRNETWIRFGAKEFAFVMDASRRSDSVRGEAHATCRDLGSVSTATSQTRAASSGVRMSSTSGELVAGLAAIETEEELEFASDEIRRRVIASGQEFAHEQWWTAGRSLAGRWIWDIDGHPTGKRV